MAVNPELADGWTSQLIVHPAHTVLSYPTGQAAVVAAEGALTSAAPSAVTSTQNSTTGAAVQSGSYVQADVATIATLANALKVSYNAAQVDIAALRLTLLNTQADLATTRTKLNEVIASLKTANIMASS